MKGTRLCFYMREHEKHDHKLKYEWILEFAKRVGIRGGTVFRAIAGYGRHGHGAIQEEHFFETASNVPVEVSFFLPKEEAMRFLRQLEQEALNVFYALSEAEYGTIGE